MHIWSFWAIYWHFCPFRPMPDQKPMWTMYLGRFSVIKPKSDLLLKLITMLMETWQYLGSTFATVCASLFISCRKLRNLTVDSHVSQTRGGDSWSWHNGYWSNWPPPLFLKRVLPPQNDCGTTKLLPSVWNQGDKDFWVVKRQFSARKFSPKQSLFSNTNSLPYKHIRNGAYLSFQIFQHNNKIFSDMLDW